MVEYPLEVREVTLRRAGRTVLHDVSVRLAGTIATAIVGPSGAGKSSLLRCLNGLERPETGDVLLDGIDIRTILPTELRRRVGMIFQTPVMFEGGVRANLRYGLREVDDDRLAAALESAGLPASFLDRESTALSVGQAQRVCIARALVRDPEVLLMDEPTSALDKDASVRIEDLIRSLVESGLTVVVVTHDLVQARRIADAAVLVVDGRAVAIGDVDQIEGEWPGEVTR